MRYSPKPNRFISKPFSFLALASLIVVLIAASLLRFSAPTQAQMASVAQAQNPPSQSAPVQVANTPATVVLDWNAIAQSTVLAAAAPAPQQYRSLAIVHTAIFDAVNALDRRYGSYAFTEKVSTDASATAAAAAAAHGALVRLYPTQQTTLDAALTASLAAVADGQAKTEGIALGEAVAEKLVALRKRDGAAQKGEYKAEKLPGVWQPTPPLFLPALLPNWNTVTPFVLKRANQFKVPAPLPINSNAYATELNEVKRLGGKDSTDRSPDQTAAGIWSAIPPAVLWNTAARAAAIERGNSLIENARLFALLNIAGLDAYIAGYEVKYSHKTWRPVTAIPHADQLGNAAVTPDPTWESLIVTPNHPDYVSGHTVSAGAEEQILKNFFGQDAVKVKIIFPANTGVTRTFTSFSQITNELIEARIWAGVHTRSADVQGAVLGRQVGQYVFANALRSLKGS